MNNATRNALTLMIAMLVSGVALAGSESSTLQVSAEVVSNCAISTTDMNFGAYDPIGANAEEALNTTGTVTIQCTLGSQVNVLLDNGQHAEAVGEGGGAPLNRKMALGENELNYELYSDAARAEVWGAASDNDLVMEGTGSPQTMTVYATVPAGQNLMAGSYSDVVTATVEFF